MPRAGKVILDQDVKRFLLFSNGPALRVFVFRVEVLSKRVQLEASVIGDLLRRGLHVLLFDVGVDLQIPRTLVLTQKQLGLFPNRRDEVVLPRSEGVLVIHFSRGFDSERRRAVSLEGALELVLPRPGEQFVVFLVPHP